MIIRKNDDGFGYSLFDDEGIDLLELMDLCLPKFKYVKDVFQKATYILEKNNKDMEEIIIKLKDCEKED